MSTRATPRCVLLVRWERFAEARHAFMLCVTQLLMSVIKHPLYCVRSCIDEGES